MVRKHCRGHRRSSRRRADGGPVRRMGAGARRAPRRRNVARSGGRRSAQERTADGDADARRASWLRSMRTTQPTRRASPIVRWVSQLLAPALDEVGLSASPSTPTTRRALRATLVGVLGGTARDPRVIAKTRELARQELDKPGSVEPTLLAVVGHARRDRRRCRPLRSLPRAQQGRDRSRGPVPVSLRADVVHGSGARAPDHGSGPVAGCPLSGREADDRAACSPARTLSISPGS